MSLVRAGARQYGWPPSGPPIRSSRMQRMDRLSVRGVVFRGMAHDGADGKAYDALLSSLQSANRAQFDAAFRVLAQEVRRSVERTIRAVGIPHGVSIAPDDVVQEVLARLTHTPPTGDRSRRDARVVVLAWIKTTTMRYLIDLRRSVERRPEGLIVAEPPTELSPSPGERCDGEQAVYTQELLELARRRVSKRLPRAVDLLELRLSHRRLTTTEEAELLGTSPANVYQMTKSIRELLAELPEFADARDRTKRKVTKE